MEELYLDFYNSLVAASPEYGKQISSTQFLKDAVTFNGEDWASLYDALPESNPILQLDKPTFVDAFTPTDEELLFLQNKYAEPVQEGADSAARTTPIDNIETSTPPSYEEQIIYKENGELLTIDEIAALATTAEDKSILGGAWNFLKGTYGSGVASGKLGNYVEVEKLIANEGFSFLSDDDYNGIAEQILKQQESQELVSDGSGGIWDLTKLLFSSVASSFIGLGTELTRDKDLLVEVGAGAAAGAAAGGAITAPAGGVGALGGAVGGIGYGISLAMIHSNLDMTAGEIFSSEVTKKLDAEGMPITGPNIRALLSDADFSAELKKDMGVGALIVGAADVVTGKLASTYLRTAKAAKAPILKVTATGMGIEAVGASTGEAAKQKAVNPDEAIDWQGVLMEGAGEWIPGALTNLNAIGKHIENRKQERTLETLLDATVSGQLETTIETFDKKTSGGLVTQESAAEVKQMAAEVQQMYEALPDDIKSDRTKAKEVVRMMMDEARIPTEIAALKAKQSTSTGFVKRRIDGQISTLQKKLAETEKSIDAVADANTDAKVTRETYVRKNAIFNLVKDELGTTPLRSSLTIEGDRFTISDNVKGAEREALGRAANTVGLTELAGVKDLNIGSTKSFRADNIKSSMDIVGKAAEGATTSKDLDTNQTFAKLKEMAKSLETKLKTETDPTRKSQTAADLRAVLEEASRKYEAEFEAAKAESSVKAKAIDGDTVLSKVERAKGVVPEGWNIEVLDDAEYEARASAAGLTKGSRAFTDGKNKTMVVNKNNALDTTVEHEVAHVILNEHFAKDADGSTARTVMQKISDKLARGNENEKQLLAQLNEYMDGSEAMSLTGKAHEFMAELSSWMANNDARLDVNKPVLAKMIQGINDFVEGITGARLLPENFTAREASAYLNKLADSIATGKTFSGNNLAPNTKSIKKADVQKTKDFYKDKYNSLADEDIDEILGITKKGETAADQKQSRAESRRTKEEEKRSQLEQRKQELSDIKKELEELKKEYQDGSTTAARREEIRGRIKALVAQAKYGPTKAEVSAIAKEKGISEAEVPEAIRKGIIDSILETGYAIKKKVNSVFEAVVQRMKTIMLAGSIAFGAFMGVTQFNQITNANTNPTLVNREIVVQLEDLDFQRYDDIVATAEQFLGQTEIRGNQGFHDKGFETLMKGSGFTKGYGWCTIFAESVLKQTAFPIAAIRDISKTFVPSTVATFNNIKSGKSKVIKYSATPSVGAIVFFQSTKNPSQGHSGIVTKVNSDGSIETIEGNTSKPGEKEGTIVARKTRNKKMGSLEIVGYGVIDRNSPLLRSKSEGGMIPNNPNPDPNQGSFWFLPFLFGGRKKKGGDGTTTPTQDVDTQTTPTIEDGGLNTTQSTDNKAETKPNVDTDAAPLFDGNDDFLNSLDEALLGLDADLQAIDTDLAAIDVNLRNIADQDGRAIIYALTDPNVSTPIHEMAHVFEHYLTPAEKNTVMKAAGTPTWTTETSEYFARGFEKYIASGVSPVKSLQKVFDKFKTWLTDIYNGITGSAIDVKLNDDMTALYDSMLADVNPNETPQSFIDFPESYVPDPRKVRQADLDFVLKEIDIEPNNTKDGVSYANQIAAAVADRLINPISLTDQDVNTATALASIYLGGQQGLTFNQVTALRVTTARLGRQLIAMKQSIETSGLQGLDASNDKDRFLEMYEKYDMLRNAVYRHSSETGRSLSQLRALLDVEIDFDAKNADFEKAYAALDNKDLKERYKKKINEAKAIRDTLRSEEAADRNASGSKLLTLAKSTLNTVKEANTKIKSIEDIFKEGKALFKKDDGPQAQTILNKTNDDLDNLEAAHAQFLNDLAMAYGVNNQKAPLAEVVADVQQKLNQFRAQNPNLAIPAFSSEHIIRSMAMANKDIRALQGRKLLGAISDLDSQSSTLPTNRRGKTQGTKQLLEALDTEIANIRANIGKNTPARDAAIKAIDTLINNITNKLVGERLGAYLGMTKETRAFEILTNARKQLVTKGVMMTDAEAKFVADSLHDLAGEIGLRKGNKIDVSDAERRLVEKYNSTKINNKVVTGTGLKEIDSDSHRLAKILYHRKLKELRALEKEADTIAREKNASSFAEVAAIKQEKFKKAFNEAWNLQRTLKFSVDLSAILVQGFNYATRGVGLLPFMAVDMVAGATGAQFSIMGNEYGKGRVTGRFKESSRAFHQVYLASLKDMIADYKGDSDGFEFTQSLIDGIMSTADGQEAMAMGVEFTLVGDSDSFMREEIYRSDFANKIPVVGKVIKSSGNVYTSHLNVVRYMMYKNFKDSHPWASDFAKKEYAKFVMSFSGRSAGFNSGPMAQIFAAPSMYLAQLKTTYYYNTKSIVSLISNAITLARKGEFKDNYEAFIKGLPTELDVASIAILKDYALKAMGLYTIQMLMGAGEWEEDEDRKSRSYGKMKKDDMDVDLGGTSVWTRIPNFAAYQLSREYVGQDFADKIFGKEKATQRSNNLRTVYDDIINAGKYKLMPTFAGTASIFDGQNVIGEGFGTSYPEHGVRLLSSVFAPIAVDMAVNDIIDVSIPGAKDRVLNKRGTDVAKYMSLVGVNLRRYENNLKHVKVEEVLNAIDYVPSATKKDAEKYIEGLGNMRDNFIRTGITDAYKADVADIVGTFILNDIESGYMPTKEELQQLKKDIAAEVGEVYADFYASKIFASPMEE